MRLASKELCLLCLDPDSLLLLFATITEIEWFWESDIQQQGW